MKRKFLKKIALMVSLMVIGQSVCTFAKSISVNEIEKIKIDKKFDTIKKHIEWWFSKDKTLFTGTASNHYDFISKEFLYK